MRGRIVPRRTIYRIDKWEDGRCDVLRSGRRWKIDLDDVEECMTVVRRAVGKGEKVELYGPRGYDGVLIT